MYIARILKNGHLCYILRESCRIENQLTCRDLFDLGSDPTTFIHYAGGNAFYFDDAIAQSISDAGAVYDADDLEDLFWPWIKPDIRRAVDTFRNRSTKSSPKKLTPGEKDRIGRHVHFFDKRRAHFLKFGNMDQGPVENMPAGLFKRLIHQSRDEIEQTFLRQEFSLKAHELKTYVYTVFDIQNFFSSFMAKKMPQVLDQDRVDAYFLKEICRINKMLFTTEHFLDDYMIRYVVMFFDYHYAHTTLLDDFARAFMSRHRFFKSGPQKSITTEKACKIFNITETELATLTRKHLTHLYRNLARQFHPDTGGSHGKFIELNNAYHGLLEKIRINRHNG
jgi:hypothetical protein